MEYCERGDLGSFDLTPSRSRIKSLRFSMVAKLAKCSPCATEDRDAVTTKSTTATDPQVSQ